MEGYKSEGVFGGIRDGLAKVITGLIGLPLDLRIKRFCMGTQDIWI